jgi:SAM-dependent methyltransferase
MTTDLDTRPDSPGLTACALCGAPARLMEAAYPGYRAPSTFSIAACDACRTSFALPLRADGGLYEQIYAQSAVIPGYERYERFARKIGRVADPLAFLAESEENYWGVREFARSLPAGAEILDVGTGLGYLAFALARAGFRATGLDLSEEAVARARSRFGDHYAAGDLFEWKRSRRESFDAVVMLELIEHVEKPREWIEAALELIRPGGALLLSTPDRDSYPDGTVWETEAPPVHLWWFSPRSIERLCADLPVKLEFTDFRSCAIEPPAMPSSVERTHRGPMLDAGGEPVGKLRVKLHRAGLLDAAMAAYAVKDRFDQRRRVASGQARVDAAHRGSLVAVLRKTAN